jgi:hypothetical protein
MRSTTRLARLLAGAALAAVLASMSTAQTMRTEAVTVSTTGTVIEGEIRSDDTVDYLVAGEAGQTLSVDLAATNPSLYFNILPEGRRRRSSSALPLATSPTSGCP